MKSKMSYKEAMSFALTKKWKASFCDQGEKCWCRILETI